MTWSRAQRLWMEHYKALIKNLDGEQTFVVQYEQWFNQKTAKDQIVALANFVGCSCTSEQQKRAMALATKSITGTTELPKVDRSPRKLHASLASPGVEPSRLQLRANLCANALELRGYSERCANEFT